MLREIDFLSKICRLIYLFVAFVETSYLNTDICASLNHRKKKAEPCRQIPQTCGKPRVFACMVCDALKIFISNNRALIRYDSATA